MPGKLSDVPANTWVLTLVSALMIGSFTMNVKAVYSNREDDQEEYRAADAEIRDDVEKLEDAFSDAVRALEALNRDLNLRVSLLEQSLQAKD